MKLLPIIFTIFFTSCTIGVSQQLDPEAKRDEEFRMLLQKAKKTQESNKLYIKQADGKTAQLITKTVNKISILKEEVKDLKVELHETHEKLYSIVDTSVIIKFILLPISDSQENRK